MTEPVDIVREIKAIDSLQALMNQTVLALNENYFFQLNILKDKRKKILREYFLTNKVRKIFLTQRIKKLKPYLYGQMIQILPDDFFISDNDIDNKRREIEGSIVFANNNDIHMSGETSIFEKIVRSSNKTIFCGWDWDNHHWLGLSCKFSGIVDLYFPSHCENLYQLTRFNDEAANVLPCATVQWSEDYLRSNFAKIIAGNRCDDLLGMHIFYDFFKYRVAVINKISEFSPKVGFRNSDFHDLTDDEKLLEWSAYKAHLIVPVLNDAPIRLFDAWNTGGIPIVPNSLKPLIMKHNPSQDDICYYGAEDILNFTSKMNEAIFKFNLHGADGIRRRMGYGINHHHGNRRLEDMISICINEYGLKFE